METEEREQPQWGIKLSKYFIIPQRDYGGDKNWPLQLQTFILNSFHLGYIVTHVPGGILADRYGVKWVLSLTILFSSISSALTPLSVYYADQYGLIGIRILTGLCQGPLVPALSVMLADWIPTKERSFLGALVLGGGQVGSVMSKTLSVFIMDNHSWPYVFYVMSILGFVWFGFFILLCYNNYEMHPFIKPKEKKYLTKRLGAKGARKDLPAIPWWDIVTSAQVMVLVSAQIGHDWAYFVIITDVPLYMADVMQFSIKNNGIISSLPYALMWTVSIVTGIIADVVISERIISVTNVRKIWTAIAAYGPAAFMIGACYAGCDRILVVIFFTLCMASMGTYFCGMKLIGIDMTPNFSGTLMGITNGMGVVTSLVAPFLVTLITPDKSLQEWRVVFWLAFLILSLATVPFCVWASGEPQLWNEGTQRYRKVSTV